MRTPISGATTGTGPTRWQARWARGRFRDKPHDGCAYLGGGDGLDAVLIRSFDRSSLEVADEARAAGKEIPGLRSPNSWPPGA